MTDIHAMRVEAGARIKRARQKKGLTQDGLAEALQKRGIMLQASTIAKIESARRSLELVEAVGISDALGMPWSELLIAPIENEDSSKFFRQNIERNLEGMHSKLLEIASLGTEINELILDWLEIEPEKRIEFSAASRVDDLLAGVVKNLREVSGGLYTVGVVAGIYEDSIDPETGEWVPESTVFDVPPDVMPQDMLSDREF
ncbi:helix-turn-helix domain-containing protein [Corynebacterium striatum]